MKRVWSILIIISIILIPIVYADDYPDDLYDGDYSLQDMLRNYSVVTFGQKDYDSHVTQLNYFSPGSVRIFHMVGNFIIKGDLDVTIKNMNPTDPFNAFRADCRTSDNSKYSYIENTIIRPFLYNYCKDRIFSSTRQVFYRLFTNYPSFYDENYTVSSKYINIERLYESITTEQNKIRKGKYIRPETVVAHIGTGGEYYIDDINEVNEIVFDNFDNNQDDLTIITINNSNNIKFPKIYASENNGEKSLISTNDFIGMERPNGSYPSNYVVDKYYGNIIWNIPNATYIKLPSAPFIGHLVAPKADVEGPELHFAGAFLVNSLALPDNSEAHFYPLQKTIPYKNTNLKAINKVDTKKGSLSFENGINNELLEEEQEVIVNVKAKGDYIFSSLKIEDEEGNQIDYESTGVEGQYKFIMPSSNVTITPIYDLEYKFIEGMDQIFNVNTHSNMKFRINMPYSEFKETGKVFIDDEEIDCNCYELSEGSTIITFKDTCTKKIKNGKHVIKTTMEDGSVCNTNFNIEQTTNIIDGDSSKNIKNPITSDKLIKVIILSVLAIVTIVYIRKRDKIKIS